MSDGEIIARGPDDVIRAIAHGAVDSFIEDWSRPAYRAAFAVSSVSAIIVMRLGASMLQAIIIGALVHVSAERLYEMAEDIHETALAQKAYLERSANAPATD